MQVQKIFPPVAGFRPSVPVMFLLRLHHCLYDRYSICHHPSMPISSEIWQLYGFDNLVFKIYCCLQNDCYSYCLSSTIFSFPSSYSALSPGKYHLRLEFCSSRNFGSVSRPCFCICLYICSHKKMQFIYIQSVHRTQHHLPTLPHTCIGHSITYPRYHTRA